MRCPFCNAANPLNTGACRVCGGPLRGTSRSSSSRAQPKETPPALVPRASAPLAPVREIQPPEIAPPVLLWRKAREKNAARVASVLFWPGENQSLFLLVLEDGSIQLWDRDASRDALHFPGPRWTSRKKVLTTCAAFAPECGILATGDEAGRVHLQRLEWNGGRSAWKLRALDAIEAHRGRVLSLAARGSRLYSGGSDGAVVVTTLPGFSEAKSARQKPQVVLDGLGALCCLAVSPDGRFFALGADDGQVQMWRLEDEAPLLRDWSSRYQPFPVKSLVFSPNGHLLVSCHLSGALRLWAAQTGHPLQLAAQEQTGDAPPAFAPDSRLLCVGHAQNKHLFDAWTGAKRHRLSFVPERVQALAFSPAPEASARKTLLVVAGEREIVAWKVAL